MDRDIVISVIFGAALVMALAGVWWLNRWYQRWEARRTQEFPDVYVQTELSTGQFARDPEAVAMAASAAYAVRFGRYADEFAFTDVDGVITRMLASSWSIRSREDLVLQLWSLLTWGHRADFDAERLGVLSLTGAERTEYLKTLKRDGRRSLRNREVWVRARRIAEDEKGAERVDFAAFDLVRVIMLCRAGEGAGLLPADLARDTANIAAAAIQQTYRSWDAYTHDELVGRWLWAAKDSAHEAENLAQEERTAASINVPEGIRTAVPITMRVPDRSLLILRELERIGVPWRAPMSTSRPWERELAAAVQQPPSARARQVDS
ncbi:DUF1266 domain-containing protein [Microbacterium sp.]|uniref:DUF1266 domain-containing protein n=1 Tax=Microbacterium sp. TaxID=51671 RepID=UPI003A8BC0B1